MEQTVSLGYCKVCGYNLESEELEGCEVNYCPICGTAIEKEPERKISMKQMEVTTMETKAKYLARMLESMAKREERLGHSNMLPMLRPESVLREAARTLLELDQEVEKAPDSVASTEQEQ